jgi:hypothetical protein
MSEEREYTKEERRQKIQEIIDKTNMTVSFNRERLTYYPKTLRFDPDVTWEQILRYIKGLYGSNEERFKKYFVEKAWDDTTEDFIDYCLENFNDVSAFSYEEVFNLENESFQTIVFSSIDITEMMENLGHECVSADSKEVTRKTYTKEGEFIDWITYENYYEVHKVDATKIGGRREAYALKCFCNTTNEAHWLWIDGYYEDPLLAVANTFYFYESLIPYIKEIKRQGDVLVVELTEDINPFQDSEGNKVEPNWVPIGKDVYFNMMTAET